MKTALVAINFQLDFFPGGGLNLENNQIDLSLLRDLARQCDRQYLVSDRHPANHVSFAGNHLWRYPGQILETDSDAVRLWLIHAVGGSFGAELHPAIREDDWDAHFFKGQDPEQEQLSAWEAVSATGQTLAGRMAEDDISRVLLAGMCLEFDIAATAVDARASGMEVIILSDLSHAAGMEEGYEQRVTDQLTSAGIRFEWSRNL